MGAAVFPIPPVCLGNHGWELEGSERASVQSRSGIYMLFWTVRMLLCWRISTSLRPFTRPITWGSTQRSHKRFTSWIHQVTTSSVLLQLRDHVHKGMAASLTRRNTRWLPGPEDHTEQVPFNSEMNLVTSLLHFRASHLPTFTNTEFLHWSHMIYKNYRRKPPLLIVEKQSISFKTLFSQ